MALSKDRPPGGGVSLSKRLGSSGARKKGGPPQVREAHGPLWSNEEIIVVGVGVLLAAIWALGFLAWVAGGLVALVTNGAWPGVSVTRSFLLLVSLVGHWDERALAWPVEDRSVLGPDWMFWSLYAVLVAVSGTLGTLALGWLRRTLAKRRRAWRVKVRQSQRDNSAIWARSEDVEGLTVDDRLKLSGRVYLGEMVNDPSTRLATPKYTSIAVIAPTGSSKTVKYVVPTILTWPDAVFVTSTKNDIADLTLGWRGDRLGRPVYVFDPAGEWPEHQQKYLAAWSPLMEIDDFADADKVSQWLSEAAMANASMDPKVTYWVNLTQIALGPMLWIAKKMNKNMQDVANWTGYMRFDEIEALFDEYEAQIGDDPAAKTDLALARRGLAATAKRDKYTLPGILANADVILKPFTSPQMAPTTDIRFDENGQPYSPYGRKVLNITDVLEEGGTIYAISDEEEQEMLRPAFQCVAQCFLRACRKKQRRLGAGPLPNPPLLLLEEAANVAPLPTLDKMAATYRGYGIVIMSIWQDEAQVATLYDTRATTVLGNHTTRVYLPGSSDDTTLDRLSRLIGDQSVAQRRLGYSHSGGRNRIMVHEGSEDVRLAPIDYLRTMPKDEAVILSGNLPPMKVSATPWFKDPEMRARIGPEMCEKYDRAFGGGGGGQNQKVKA
ncbi:type IV secretory system conjugative DNA transfer family protein [Actinomadura miaoliensis]|uniref:Type IV secretory system conjugative DNA transfer family protein n=1 Tax=Actinomadura miaoliensis TaxID=430685 RepID=A0ABP7V6P9_9ACTN